jgi:hypothetical protein
MTVVVEENAVEVHAGAPEDGFQEEGESEKVEEGGHEVRVDLLQGAMSSRDARWL